MGETRQVDRALWGEFAVAFTRENRGRVAKIDLAGGEIGDEALASDVALFALDRDPDGKGDDFVLSTGLKAPEQTHVIHSPSEVWQELNDAGRVSSLEIVGPGGLKTILRFA